MSILSTTSLGLIDVDKFYLVHDNKDMRGQVRHIGVSNETSWGVTRFTQLAAQLGLPKIVSIQNSYSLLARALHLLPPSGHCARRGPVCSCLLLLGTPVTAGHAPKRQALQRAQVRSAFETDLAEVCAPRQCNVGLLAYSPLAGGALSGKYIAGGKGHEKSRFNIFPGYMERCVTCACAAAASVLPNACECAYAVSVPTAALCRAVPKRQHVCTHQGVLGDVHARAAHARMWAHAGLTSAGRALVAEPHSGCGAQVQQVAGARGGRRVQQGGAEARPELHAAGAGLVQEPLERDQHHHRRHHHGPAQGGASVA